MRLLRGLGLRKRLIFSAVWRRQQMMREKVNLASNSTESMKAFVNGPFHEIPGWCSPYIFQVLQPIAYFQDMIGLHKPVCEIGVFKGKFFLSMVKASGLAEGHYAMDVFDLQEFNLDYAGVGNLAEFRKNIALAGEDPEKVTCIERDSTTFRSGELTKIREVVGGFSMFSVDGCHMVEHTINDIRIAMELTADAGVIFVDDYYNPAWPGVHEAVCKLYMTGSPVYVPLAYTSNKLVLCHIGYHSRYLDILERSVEQHFPETDIKKAKMFGYQTLVLNPAHGSSKILA